MGDMVIWMTGCATKVEQAALSQNDDGSSGGQCPFVHLGLDGFLGAGGRLFQIGHIDLIIKMADIADDGLVLHLFHVT